MQGLPTGRCLGFIARGFGIEEYIRDWHRVWLQGMMLRIEC